MLIRTADALALFDNSPARLAAVFPSERRRGKVRAGLTRQAVDLWGEYLPELRARQLVELKPDAAALIVGEDGLTAVERQMRRAVDQSERSQAEKEDSRG